MLRISQILLLILTYVNCYSQKDTLYLFQDYVILNNEKLNFIDRSGNKTGKWIDYEICYPNNILPIEIVLGSGDNVHFYSTIYCTYRPLNEGEYDGIKILLSKKVDSTENVKYYNLEYREIHYKIPSTLLCIESIGNFKNSLKQGLWEYFYPSGKTKKKIYYKNGIPTSNFKIYRENGTLMIGFVIKNDSTCEISKYKENGDLIETIISELNEFKELY